MTSPKIEALGVTQQWSTTSGKATGYVEGVGWPNHVTISRVIVTFGDIGSGVK
jgi:hypothetical protein